MSKCSVLQVWDITQRVNKLAISTFYGGEQHLQLSHTVSLDADSGLVLQGEVMARKLYEDAVERQSLVPDPAIMGYLRGLGGTGATISQQASVPSVSSFTLPDAPQLERQRLENHANVPPPAVVSLHEILQLISCTRASG